MTSAAVLSVVLPNYNHAHLIARAVHALAMQDSAPDEIIIVDDGSTDDSLTVIEAIAAKVATVRILRHPTNRGAIPALQRGLDAARGRFVYFAAADDWVMPGFFRAALDALDANPTIGLFCGEAVLVDGRSNRPFDVRPAVRPKHGAGPVSAAETRKMLMRIDNWILTGSSVFRRDFVVEAGGFDVRLGSFADGVMARKVALTHGFHYSPKIVAVWAVSADSYSRATALDEGRANQALLALPAHLSADTAFPAGYPALFERRWRFATSRLALLAEPVDRGMLRKMAERTVFDRIALNTALALKGRRLARSAVLAWLWLRLRPTGLFSFARSALAFRMSQFPKDPRSPQEYAPLAAPSLEN